MQVSTVVRLITMALLLPLYGFSQANEDTISSENGWILPTEGTFRVLLVFVEMEYDTDSDLDKFPDGTEVWKKGELPDYKDEIFNVYSSESELKRLTAYYRECSFGEFEVLGDYFPQVITLKYSDIGNNRNKLFREITQAIEEAETISASGLGISDFDLWENTSKKGIPKKPSQEYDGIDHLMIILRNYHRIPRGTGQASGYSAGLIHGQKVNSYSIFGGGDKLPFGIMRHEFNHLLIGGNNFHTGGGNSVPFKSYNYFIQAGWSMMGAANSSFLTCAGWDRYWLGWKPSGKNSLIEALDSTGNSVESDVKPFRGHRDYILRDFVTTGDVLRIELPFIPENEYGQWIWVENHTTQSLNGSPFDVFQYEHHDCMAKAEPGLYLARQINANRKKGKGIYTDVNADYLKPLPADGAYDFVFDSEETSLDYCVGPNNFRAYELMADLENPLTGNHTMEFPLPYDQDDTMVDYKKAPVPGLRRIDGEYLRLPYHGYPEQGFRESGKRMLGLGTNPASASVLTNLNNKKRRSTNPKNSDRIYLNGISLRILQTFPDGSIKVRISYDDNLIEEDRRWSAPEIVLNDHVKNGDDLLVKATLTLDRGQTLTRFTQPDSVEGRIYFTSPTVLIVKKGASLKVDGELILLKDSRLTIEAGGHLILERKGRLTLNDRASVHFEEGAEFSGKGKIKIKAEAEVEAGKDLANRIVKRTCQKKKVRALAAPR